MEICVVGLETFAVALVLNKRLELGVTAKNKHENNLWISYTNIKKTQLLDGYYLVTSPRGGWNATLPTRV